MCESAKAYVENAIAVGNTPRNTTQPRSPALDARASDTRSPANGRQAMAPTVHAIQVTSTAGSRATSGFCRIRLTA